jgi:hypothetical protein
MDPASNPPSSEPQTPTSATPPRSYQAAHAVLNTNELICEIIGRLPLEDIVVTTGVCKTWRNALEASVTIQQALFLVPAGIREIATTTKCLSMRVQDIARKQYTNIGRPNPYTIRIFGQMGVFGEVHWRSRGNNFCKLLPRFDHPVATWRHMFLTQPPITTVNTLIYLNENTTKTGHRVRTQHVAYSFTSDEGIKMGELHDYIRSKEQRYQESSSINFLDIKLDIRSAAIEAGFYLERGDICVIHPNNRWWEVRNGKVHRKLKLPDNLIDLTGEVPDTDPSDFQTHVWPSLRRCVDA